MEKQVFDYEEAIVLQRQTKEAASVLTSLNNRLSKLETAYEEAEILSDCINALLTLEKKLRTSVNFHRIRLFCDESGGD